MQTIKHPLAYVRDITGQRIHLGLFESVGDIRAEETQIVIAINRARCTEQTRKYLVTSRGTTLYTFRRTDQGWRMTGTVMVWWSTDETHLRF